MTMRNIDPVARQADALKRLWGAGAPQIARRYLADAQRLRKEGQIKFWTDVLAAVEAPAEQASTSEAI